TGGVVVTADPADATGDEVRVPRVLALHEQRVAAEDRRGAEALDDFAVVEIDLGVDAEAADDAGDRIPGHLDQLAGFPFGVGRFGTGPADHVSHDFSLLSERRPDRRSRGAPAAAVGADPLPGTGRAGLQGGAGLTPPGFLVDGAAGDVPQAADDRAVQGRRRRRDLAARRFVHERHELVREARHGAPDADAADVRATADAVDPPALRHIALDYWSPTAKFHNAFRRSVLGGEVTLLVVARPVAPLVHRLAEQPLRA